MAALDSHYDRGTYGGQVSLARRRLRDAGALGADVTVTVERGERMFAVGDRIMFLRNERSLGVKNGTLGVLEQASPERVAAKLDDGRQVALDLKDYAHLDHGYAATFHKAQGVTVDRAHVLATPGMDRHSAYVGMSRHRDRLDLHYAHDDSADRDAFVRTLSRDRSKDMASDYADAFVERRGWERLGREGQTPSPEAVRSGGWRCGRRSSVMRGRWRPCSRPGGWPAVARAGSARAACSRDGGAAPGAPRSRRVQLSPFARRRARLPH